MDFTGFQQYVHINEDWMRLLQVQNEDIIKLKFDHRKHKEIEKFFENQSVYAVVNMAENGLRCISLVVVKVKFQAASCQFEDIIRS